MGYSVYICHKDRKPGETGLKCEVCVLFFPSTRQKVLVTSFTSKGIRVALGCGSVILRLNCVLMSQCFILKR
jgi:hypothetical protein